MKVVLARVSRDPARDACVRRAVRILDRQANAAWNANAPSKAPITGATTGTQA